MSETVIDSLIIEIEGKSNGASGEIDKLAVALERLKSSSSLTKTTNNLSKLSSSISGLSKNSTGLSNINKLAESLRTLESLGKVTNLTSALNQLKKVPDIVKSLDTATVDKFGLKMKALAVALEPLSAQISQLSAGFGKLPNRIKSCVAATNSFSGSMGKAGKTGNGLFSGLSSGLGRLSLFGFTTNRISSGIATSIGEINDYVEKVNYFNVVMAEFTGKAKEYAEFLQDKMGIDSKQFMDSQATFMTMANGFGLAREKAYKLSIGLTELAYDISSLKNEDIATVFQRLQSGIAGEIEPVRRWGVALDQASMKQWLLRNGIEANVNTLTQADKALVRYNMLVETMAKNGAIYDFARTLSSPANALRVLKQQITQLVRAIGSLFIPILVVVIPYVQAFVKVITEAISAIATLIGFEMPKWDNTSWDGVSTAASSTASSLGDSAKKAKELKNAMLGIDELNVISPNTDSSAEQSTGSGLGIEPTEVWDKSVLDGISSKVDEIVPKVKGLLTATLAVGAAFLAWKIGSAVVSGIPTVLTAVNSLRTACGFLTGKTMIAPTSGIQSLISGLGTKIPLILGVAAAITLITLAVIDLWKNSEKFRYSVKNVVSNVGEAFTELKTTIWEYAVRPIIEAFGGTAESLKQVYEDYIRPILEKIGVLFVDIFGAVIVGAIKGFSSTIQTVTGFLKGLFTGDWSTMLDGLGKMWDSVWGTMKDVGLSLWDALPDGAKESLKGVWDKITGGWDSIKKWFKEKVAPIFTKEYWVNKFKCIGNGLITGVENGVNGAIKGINELTQGLRSLGNKALDFFGLNFEIKAIPTISLQKFASGGVIEDGLFTMNKGEIAGKFSDGTSVVANNQQIIAGITDGVTFGINQAIGNDFRYYISLLCDFVRQMKTEAFIWFNDTEIWLKNHSKDIGKTITDLTTSINGTLNSLKTEISSGFSDVVSAVGSLSGMINSMNGAIANMKGEISDIQSEARLPEILTGATSTTGASYSYVAGASKSEITAAKVTANMQLRESQGYNVTPRYSATGNLVGYSATKNTVKKYATGGFLEDGLFTMNRGELAGKFNNGKSVVANNEQITDGIARAVYEAMLKAEREREDRTIIVPVNIDGRQITKAVNKTNGEKGRTIMGDSLGYNY